MAGMQRNIVNLAACDSSASTTDMNFRACTEMASSASVSRFVAEPLDFVLFRGDRVVVGSSGATAFRSWNDLLRSADLHQQCSTFAFSTNFEVRAYADAGQHTWQGWMTRGCCCFVVSELEQDCFCWNCCR